MSCSGACSVLSFAQSLLKDFWLSFLIYFSCSHTLGCLSKNLLRAGLKRCGRIFDVCNAFNAFLYKFSLLELFWSAPPPTPPLRHHLAMPPITIFLLVTYENPCLPWKIKNRFLVDILHNSFQTGIIDWYICILNHFNIIVTIKLAIIEKTMFLETLKNVDLTVSCSVLKGVQTILQISMCWCSVVP